MKLYLFDPYYMKILHNNNLFNEKLGGVHPFFTEVKKIMFRYNIDCQTMDMCDPMKADKLIFFDYDEKIVEKIRRMFKKQEDFINKSYLFINECPIIKSGNWDKRNHIYFKKIYTWNDAWIDNKKYFHYYLPIAPLKKSTRLRHVQYTNKKLLVLVNAYKIAYAKHELYSKRINAIRFFQMKHFSNFDLFGKGWDTRLPAKYAYYLKDNPFKLLEFLSEFISGYRDFSSYRGALTDEEKIPTMARYKFALCFENMSNIEGYITEKIFDCFKANCVPVYWGASNIDTYIPSNTFIDFREFMDYEKLYNHLTSMSRKEYDTYISEAEKFLHSTMFGKWSPTYFTQEILLKL